MLDLTDSLALVPKSGININNYPSLFPTSRPVIILPTFQPVIRIMKQLSDINVVLEELPTSRETALEFIPIDILSRTQYQIIPLDGAPLVMPIDAIEMNGSRRQVVTHAQFHFKMKKNSSDTTQYATVNIKTKTAYPTIGPLNPVYMHISDEGVVSYDGDPVNASVKLDLTQGGGMGATPVQYRDNSKNSPNNLLIEPVQYDGGSTLYKVLLYRNGQTSTVYLEAEYGHNYPSDNPTHSNVLVTIDFSGNTYTAQVAFGREASDSEIAEFSKDKVVTVYTGAGNTALNSLDDSISSGFELLKKQSKLYITR